MLFKEYNFTLGIITLKILEGLSFISAEQYLQDSGYVLGECIKKSSEECDAILIYPYLLYNKDKCVIDKVCREEYCMLDEEGELEDFKSRWIRI